MIAGLVAVAAAIAACDATGTETSGTTYHVIAGGFASGRGPDGNSIFFDAPEGLILVDTGRHPEHQQKLLSFAKDRGQPIAAIVNTHWHLDHSGGNAEIKAVYPDAPLYTSTAIDGALTGFFERSRVRVAEYLKSGQASTEQQAETRRDLAAMDDPDSLKPTIPVTESGTMTIAGRSLTVNLAYCER